MFRWLTVLVFYIKKALGFCQEAGCWRHNVVPCFVPDWSGPDSPDRGPDFLYCPAHCHSQGFCWGCGQFFGGIEEFDFSTSGLCEVCRDEFMTDSDADDEDWFEYDEEAPDA